MSTPKFTFSLIGPQPEKNDTWALFVGPGGQQHGIDLSRALDILRMYIAKTKTQRATIWVRTTTEARAHNICPVVWCRGRAKGPGRGAVKLGSVKMQDMMDTIEAHARMM